MNKQFFLFFFIFYSIAISANEIFTFKFWNIEVREKNIQDDNLMYCWASQKNSRTKTDLTLSVDFTGNEKAPSMFIIRIKDEVFTKLNPGAKVKASLGIVRKDLNNPPQLFSENNHIAYIQNGDVVIAFYTKEFSKYDAEVKARGLDVYSKDDDINFIYPEWEQLYIQVDRFPFDYKRYFDMDGFSKLVQQLYYCHNNRFDYIDKIIKIKNDAKAKQKALLLKEIEEAEKIKKEKERALLVDAFNKEINARNACLLRGKGWRFFEFGEIKFCGNIYASPSSYDEDEDEGEGENEEVLDDAMFDEGTPQCDKGTWYEKNGYC